MRRILALVAAVLLVAAVASSGTVIAVERGAANGFSGDFDMVAGDGTVVAHVVARFREPTDRQLVPGTVDIAWKVGDVRESHAQVLKAYFWPLEDHPVEGRQVAGRVVGSICDYTGPQGGSCQPFSMAFVDTVNRTFRNHVGFSVPGSTVCCDGQWYDVGRGDFALSYVGLTPDNALPIGSHDGSQLEVANGELCYANGWAVDLDSPSTRLDVRISVDGAEVWRGTAADFRQDILDEGLSDGYSGFWVSLVGVVRPDEAHVILVEARDANTGEWQALNKLTPPTLTCIGG